MDMLDKLSEVEKMLPELLKNEQQWSGLFIDYHPPFVERLWLQWDNHRISLHCIHPCAKEEALFHPHPWPSAMKIVRGNYEMAVGYGLGNTPPPVAALIILPMGSSYEMTDPNAWHYVRPLTGESYTLMITGKPWARESPQPNKTLRPLSKEQRRKIFDLFKFFYRRP